MNFYKLNTLHNEDPVKETEQKLPRAPFNHDDITPTSRCNHEPDFNILVFFRSILFVRFIRACSCPPCAHSDKVIKKHTHQNNLLHILY